MEVTPLEAACQTGYRLLRDATRRARPRRRAAATARWCPTCRGGPLALFTHLARTALFLEALQDECLDPSGISFGDYSVLRVLRIIGPPHRLSPRQLADVVLRTTGGMTKIIDRLQRAGLVRATPDPDDRRGVLVGSPGRAWRISDQASEAYTVGRERILGQLDPPRSTRSTPRCAVCSRCCERRPQGGAR